MQAKNVDQKGEALMNTNKMREQFEAAVKAKWPGIRMLRVNRPGSPVDGEYELPGLEGAWWGWQASREAVVVELPRPYESAPPYACYEGGWNDMRVEAVDVIEAQGLKVAP